MKAVVSTTYDDKYLFFLPIITWCWNKLGVDVICFMPIWRTQDQIKNMVVTNALKGMKCDIGYFDCPPHKEATYAQCSRLYAAALDLPEDEVIITSDVDMGIFSLPYYVKTCANKSVSFTVHGVDLVPTQQLPMCYIVAPSKLWREAFDTSKGFQKCLDDLLGHIECESFRGNYWGADQEQAYLKIKDNVFGVHRARRGTQFAMNRVDRDDINWRSYLGPDLIDAHLWRPGYTEENFANILELLQTQYPEDNFQWMIDYRNEYIKLT